MKWPSRPAGFRVLRPAAWLFVAICLAALVDEALADSAPAEAASAEGTLADVTFDSEPVLLVRVPEFRLQDWAAAHGVVGKRAYDHFAENGVIHSPQEISPALLGALSSWEQVTSQNIVWSEGQTDAALPITGQSWFGAENQRMEVSWSGERAETRVREASSDLALSLWLNRPDVVRWEEVVEMLDLTRTENAAFRRLTQEEHPLVQFRSAFLRDKRRASLTLYLNARYSPPLLSFALELPVRFEREVKPFAGEIAGTAEAAIADGDESERATGLYFASRIQNSIPSVAGRIDRVLQSLAAESSKNTWIVVDARESSDPFVAWIGPERAPAVPPVFSPSGASRTRP